MARAISFTFINGLHGVPSLRIVIRLEATAFATKSFRTKSNLNLSLHPQAVENLRHVTLKPFFASGSKSLSVRAFDFAYAVKGLNGDFSVLGLSSAEPYKLQLEAKVKDFTPFSLAFLARAMLAR
jgi:hypothetical protein